MNSNSDIHINTLLNMPSLKDLDHNQHYPLKRGRFLKDMPLYWKLSFLCVGLLLSFFLLQGWINHHNAAHSGSPFQFRQLISTANELQVQTHIGEAHELYRKALPLAKTAIDSSSTLNQLGATYNAQHDYYSSLHTYRMAADQLDRSKSVTKNSKYWEEKIKNVKGLGDAHLALDEADSAMFYYTQARELYQTHLASSSYSLEHVIAQIWHQSGKALASLQEFTGARLAYEKALGIWDTLRETSGKYEPFIAKSTGSLGLLFAQEGDFVVAERMLRDTYRIYRKLSRQNPEGFRSYLAESITDLGILYKGFEMYEAAIASFEEAEGIYRLLADIEPGVYLVPLAMVLNHKAFCQQQVAQYFEAEKSYRTSIVLLDQHPTPNAENQYFLRKNLLSLYDYMRDQQFPLDYDQKVQPIQSALDTLKELIVQSAQKTKGEGKDTLASLTN